MSAASEGGNSLLPTAVARLTSCLRAAWVLAIARTAAAATSGEELISRSVVAIAGLAALFGLIELVCRQSFACNLGADRFAVANDALKMRSKNRKLALILRPD